MPPFRQRNSYLWLSQYSFRILFAALLFITVFINKSFGEANAVNGEKLFKQYCTQCHKAAPFDTKLVGPALKDVHKRESEEWLIKWIRNNAALRASGDKHAVDIYNEYGHNEMPQFTSFTDDDIKSIIAYIANPPVIADKGPEGPNPPSTESPSIWLYIVVIVLLVIIIMVFRANKALKRMALAKEGYVIPEEIPWSQRLRTRNAYFLYGLILVFLVGWTLTSSAIRLSHSKDYQPEQPIAFPHDLHAGIAQINCLYCHAGAEKSKVAGIPPVSTCMNCHKGIQAGQSPEGTAEIQKIYAAYDNNKPIQWTKIHNLPDHVYFNHSQHVSVGKIACQTCHGPIQEMEQVYQFSSLSMGWCINCHRETGVQFTQNKFYSMYSEMQEKFHKDSLMNPNDTTLKITEAMMGGTECQKCHY
ncbi:MAG: c-type cytochrome [Chitinophagales bacterium]